MILSRKQITGCATSVISPPFLSRISRSTLKLSMSVYLLLSVNSVRNLTRLESHLENTRFKVMRMCSTKSLIFKEDNKVGSNIRFSFFWVFYCCKTLLPPGPVVQLSHDEVDDFLLANNTRDSVTSLWQCGLCGKSSINKFDINRHLEAQHVHQPPVLCDICHRSYKNKESLRKHAEKAHKSTF